MVQKKKQDVSLPSLSPLPAPLAELSKDEMRERQRLHVKRTYYRKLNVLQTLRSEVDQLEKQYDGLVTQKREAERNSLAIARYTNVGAGVSDALLDDLLDSPTSSEPPTNDGHANANKSLANLRELYAQLSEMKERLRAQNEAMAAAVADHNRYAQKLKSWIELDEIASSSSGDEVNLNQDTSLPRSSVPRLAGPVSMDVCHAVARSTYADMQVFRETHSFLTTGVSVFGWRDKRVRYGDRVKFSLKKIFHGISALDLYMRGWPVVASAKRLPTLYSSSIDMKIVPLQRVDDDNEILFRMMTSPDGRVQVKTLFVVSRFAIPDGYVILLQSLDRNLLAPYKVPPGVMEQWIDYYTWIRFEHYGQNREHCILDFGGEVQSNSVLGSDKWMLEVLLIALRWEMQVYGQVFSLC